MKTDDGGIFVGPDDGKELPNPVGGRMVVKIRDEDSAGAYSIHDNTILAGSPGPRPHIHRYHEEAFYVLEGELTVRVGPRTITALAGSFVVVPRGCRTPTLEFGAGADQVFTHLFSGGDGPLL